MYRYQFVPNFGNDTVKTNNFTVQMAYTIVLVMIFIIDGIPYRTEIIIYILINFLITVMPNYQLKKCTKVIPIINVYQTIKVILITNVYKLPQTITQQSWLIIVALILRPIVVLRL